MDSIRQNHEGKANTPFNGLPKGSLRILQITDCHLYADPSQRLSGVNTLSTFDQVVSQAIDNLGKPDLVIATGDLVHDASDVGYKRLLGRLSEIDAPSYCLPGNHDLPSKMTQILNQEPVHCVFSTIVDGWSLIFLDTTVPNQTAGFLDTDRLRALNQELDRHPDKHTLICLHHQPVPVGSQWIDNLGLRNSSEFMSLVSSHAQVKGLLWGHVHQAFEGTYGRIKLFGTPSTCIQFVSGQDNFAIDACPPGYRWLTLLPDGVIQSKAEVLSRMPVDLDMATVGY